MCPAPKSFEEKILYVANSFNMNFYKTMTYKFMHSDLYAKAFSLAYIAKDKRKTQSLIGNTYLRMLAIRGNDFPDLPTKQFEDLELFTLTKNGIYSITFEIPDCMYESQAKYFSLTWPSSSIQWRRVYTAELFEDKNELGLALSTKKGHYLLNTFMNKDISIEDFAEIAVNEFSNTLMWETIDLEEPPKV